MNGVCGGISGDGCYCFPVNHVLQYGEGRTGMATPLTSLSPLRRVHRVRPSWRVHHFRYEFNVIGSLFSRMQVPAIKANGALRNRASLIPFWRWPLTRISSIAGVRTKADSAEGKSSSAEKKKMRTALARHSNEPYFCLTALSVSFFQFIKSFILFRRKVIALWCLGPAAGRIFSSMRHAVNGGTLAYLRNDRRRLAKASANRENKRKMLWGNCVFFLEWRGVLSGCYRTIKCGPCWLLKKRRKRNRRKECKSSLIQSRKESVGGERGSLSAWPKSIYRMKSTRGGRRR